MERVLGFITLSVHVNATFPLAGHVWSDCALKAFVDFTVRQKTANVLALACVVEDLAFMLPVNLSQISGLRCCFQPYSCVSPSVN